MERLGQPAGASTAADASAPDSLRPAAPPQLAGALEVPPPVAGEAGRAAREVLGGVPAEPPPHSPGSPRRLATLPVEAAVLPQDLPAAVANPPAIVMVSRGGAAAAERANAGAPPSLNPQRPAPAGVCGWQVAGVSSAWRAWRGMAGAGGGAGGRAAGGSDLTTCCADAIAPLRLSSAIKTRSDLMTSRLARVVYALDTAKARWLAGGWRLPPATWHFAGGEGLSAVAWCRQPPPPPGTIPGPVLPPLPPRGPPRPQERVGGSVSAAGMRRVPAGLPPGSCKRHLPCRRPQQRAAGLARPEAHRQSRGLRPDRAQGAAGRSRALTPLAGCGASPCSAFLSALRLWGPHQCCLFQQPPLHSTCVHHRLPAAARCRWCAARRSRWPAAAA